MRESKRVKQMETIIIDMKDELKEQDIKRVAKLLRSGEIVAFPTETVYGVGADATNEAAVQKIFQAKGRPGDNPLNVLVASKEELYELVQDVPEYVEKMLDAFSPGPITYVLKSRERVAKTVTAGLSTLGVRIPDHPIALSIIREAGVPVAAPSANRSGKPSPTKAEHVIEDLYGRVAAIVDGGATNIGLESTVVDCTGDHPVILRPGAITAEQIVDATDLSCTVYEKKAANAKTQAPALKYKHYTPEVPLILVNVEKMEMEILKAKAANKRIALIFQTAELAQLEVDEKLRLGDDEVEVAQQLYEILRSFKNEKVDVVFCEYPIFEHNQAIINRLTEAAAKIIE